jgi:mono/diheme cytochrome c family protein
MKSRTTLRNLFIALLLLTSNRSTFAAILPETEELKKKVAQAPVAITVAEPHLSSKSHLVKVSYVGYPIEKVLDLLFGPSWKESDRDLEFRALDGYVSRIHLEHFKKYRAYLVFARQDNKPFEVDNPGQNQKKVPLGPYYLAWDNLSTPELLALGTTHWPYQVTEILQAPSIKAALLPGNLATQYSEHADLAQKYCLPCHQINGHGGNKYPSNLAEQVKKMNEQQFINWVLAPNTVKPGTTMPPMGGNLPKPEREKIARKLYEYLQAVPVIKQEK